MGRFVIEDAPQGRFVIDPADPKIGQPEELTWYEKLASALPDSWGAANIRGSEIGRLAKGASNAGVAVAQMAANALPGDIGQRANSLIAERESEYQDARKQAGSDGFDGFNAVGDAGMQLFALPLRALQGLSGFKAAAGNIGVGGASGILQPVTDGGEHFVTEKAKQAGIGAGTAAVMSPLIGALARVVSPNASTNPNLQLLKNEGVQPSVGQSLGGMWNSLEEKAQSLPIFGSFIQSAREGAGKQLEGAAYRRAADPIGATVENRGHAGIAELQGKLGDAYEQAIPRLSANVLDPSFVGKLASLRSLVQSLPEREAKQFDDTLVREIEGRMSPNGTLTGQGLKDAWNALRDKGAQFSKSNDAYQAQLGQAYKQAFQELKDHVSATNPADAVLALKNADFGYANFKRLQRAAGSLGADEGRFTPAQLQNAVKAMDQSKDKARFAEGAALMQDLSSAGKSVLSNKVPDSGTAGRGSLMTLLGLGTIPLSPIYTPPVQNALRALVSNRPEMAPVVANYLRQLQARATVGAVPALGQGIYDR